MPQETLVFWGISLSAGDVGEAIRESAKFSLVPASSTDSTPDAPLPWWGRIETIWLFLPTLCALIYALCQPLAPNDLWYHVRAGEFLARLGHIPTQNGMSTAIPLQTPYYYQSWISEAVLYQTLKVAGLTGLQILRAVCLGLAWGLVSLTAFRALRREANGTVSTTLPAARAVALATVWGFVMSSNNVDLRPQTLSVLLFGLWLFALSEFFAAQSPARANAWGVAMVVLAAFWANTHGAFAVSLVSLGALTLGTAVCGQKASAWRGAVLFVLCALAVCLNPRGVGIYQYLLALTSDPVSQKYIQEWQPPTLSEWHNVVFFLSVPLCLVAAVLDWRKNRQVSPWLWVLVALCGMGLRNMRSITWFALACPILISGGIYTLTNRPTVPKAGTLATPPARVTALINAVILCFLLLLPIGLLPGIKALWPWPPEFRARFAPTPPRLFPGDPPLLLERTTAVEPVEYLVAHPPQGKLFTDMVCGSYMTWASHPKVLPLCDPRIELFPAAFWEKDYMRLIAGPKGAAAELEKRRFSDVLLDSDLDEPLLKRLQESGRWKIVARGGKTILLRNFSQWQF